MPDLSDRDRSLLESIRDGVYTLDPQGHITYVNRAAIEEFDLGYRRNDLLGAHVSTLLSEQDIEQCTLLIQQLLDNDATDSGRCEIELQTATGARIPYELHLTLLPMDDGEFRGTVGVLRDISERRQRKQQLRVMHRVLRHNLRNKMHVIAAYAELLETELTGDHATRAQIIRENCDDLLATSEKVQSIFQLRETAEGEPVSVNLPDIAASVVADFHEAYPAATITLDAPATATVTAQSTELVTAAVRNLLENAISHSDRETPQIEMRVESDDSQAQIHIEDNGPGLPTIEREVFQEEMESPLRHSTGLGLWVAYWSVQLSNGTIEFADRDPRGTRVTLTYPAA